jgi:hypothetical protein
MPASAMAKTASRRAQMADAEFGSSRISRRIRT